MMCAIPLQVVKGNPIGVFDFLRTELIIFDFQKLVSVPEHIVKSDDKVEWEGMTATAWVPWSLQHWGAQPMRATLEALAKRFPTHEIVVVSDKYEWEAT